MAPLPSVSVNHAEQRFAVRNCREFHGTQGRKCVLASPVDLRRDGSIAVIMVDNPPVNALRYEVRAGIMDALQRARDDASAEAVVIGCAGRTFIAGADITE